MAQAIIDIREELILLLNKFSTFLLIVFIIITLFSIPSLVKSIYKKQHISTANKVFFIIGIIGILAGISLRLSAFWLSVIFTYLDKFRSVPPILSLFFMMFSILILLIGIPYMLIRFFFRKQEN